MTCNWDRQTCFYNFFGNLFSFLIITSILPSEYVKDIIRDFRNTDTVIPTTDIISASNNTSDSSITNNKDDEAIENKFLSSLHITFFVSSIIVFIAIIPAIIKEKHIIKLDVEKLINSNNIILLTCF
jgi:hypothetical protein